MVRYSQSEGGGMVFERRRFKRFDVPLEVQFKLFENPSEYLSGITKNFSREGLCFESPDIDPELFKPVELKVKLPNRDTFTDVLGDIVWKEMNGNSCIAGIKFRVIEKECKSEILDYAYDLWVAKKQN
jgi:hypothetical protein